MLERVLSVPVPDIVEDLFGEFAINPIELRADQMDTPGAIDAPVRVEGAGRKIRGDGKRIEFRIPFSGDADLFDLRPSSFTMNRPRFRYTDSHVIVSYEGRSPVNKDAAKARLDSVIAEIEKATRSQAVDIDPFNRDLRASLTAQVETRRKKVLADRELEAFFEVPVIGRDNASPSFTVDPPKRPKPEIASTPAALGFPPEQPLNTLTGELIQDPLRTPPRMSPPQLHNPGLHDRRHLMRARLRLRGLVHQSRHAVSRIPLQPRTNRLTSHPKPPGHIHNRRPIKNLMRRFQPLLHKTQHLHANPNLENPAATPNENTPKQNAT